MLSAFWLVFAFVIGVLAVKEAHGVSFYGSSYLKLPLRGTSLSRGLSEVELDFKTSRTKGLLLVAIGAEDHLLLRLKRGQVQAELRAGTSSPLLITSRVRPKFSDVEWHTVRLTLTENEAQLYVDDVLHRETSLSSRYRTLATDLSLFIGGSGMLDELEFLTASDLYFRGCMQDIKVNGRKVLNIIQRNDNAIITEVTWDCSTEFEANRDDPFSFVKDTSFVSFQKWLLRTQGSISFWMKTSSQNGLLIFNPGKLDSFFSTELWKGRLRVLFNGGGENVGILSSVSVSDSQWHFVQVSISRSQVEISIDLVPESFTLEQEVTFSLTSDLFIGGVVHRARIQAVEVGLHSITHPTTGGSFEGCLRDIEVDSAQLTLGDSQVTHGIEVGCVYQFPCSDDPCRRRDVCRETGTTGYECLCPSCLLTTPPPNTNTSVALVPAPALNQEGENGRPLFLINDLSVNEGGGSLITTDNIHLNFNLDDMDLRESQIVFRVVSLPKYGQLDNDVPGRQDARSFTLLDLFGRKISYVHYGSENFHDMITFEMSVVGKKSGVPSRLRNGIVVQLPVDIVPVNDPPFIIIAGDNSLQIVSETRRQITSDFLMAEDPDTAPEELLFSIISQPGGVGHFQLLDGGSTPSFTQADINNNKLFYVHTGPQQKSRIVLRVSDSVERSDIQSLRIEATLLSLKLENASLVLLNPQGSLIMTPETLRVSTNDPEGNFDVTYRVITPPQFGELQKRDLEDSWFHVTTFLQRDIDDGRIRYIALGADGQSPAVTDEAVLSADSAGATVDAITLQFRIVVTELYVERNTGLLMDSVRQSVISSSNLSAEVNNSLFNAPIVFKILRTPVRGDLLMHPDRLLTVADNFTMDDIENNLISYQAHPQHQEGFNDSFLFQCVLPKAESKVEVFSLTYIPDLQQLTIVNRGATVEEGGNVIINRDNFYIICKATGEFTFTVTKSPVHGVLQLYDPATFEITESNVTSFLSYDLRSGQLRYQHDDSESTSDEFCIDVHASYVNRFGEVKSIDYNTTFNISVQLLNDNLPQRTVNKVFKVLKNGKTILTDGDLSYHDEDSDFDDGDIYYQRLTIRHGDLVRAVDESVRVMRFSQRDLEEGNLVFKHRGDVLTTRMMFFVFDNDRSNLQNAFLDIEAYEPYLEAVNNTGLKVQKGATGIISSTHLCYESNLKIAGSNIIYLVTSPPRHGQLLVENTPMRQFTQEDLSSGTVSYISSNQTVSGNHDSFNFTVQGRDLTANSTFSIRVYLESTQTLPELIQNQTLYVEEGLMVLVPKSALKMTHPNHPVSELVYTVTTQPRYGFLEVSLTALIDIMEQEGKTSTIHEFPAQPLTTFTQQDINRKRLVYVHVIPGHVEDTMVFDITNGFTTLTDVALQIGIVPGDIPVNNQNLTVEEGKSKAILSEHLNVSHPYYKDLDFQVYVVDQPRFGILEMVNSKGEPLTSFSTRDIRNEFVYYVHNGSESAQDSFTLILNSTALGKQSDPVELFVSVIPVNDRPPVVTVNGKLAAFSNTRTPITTSSLSAEDADTPDSEIVFSITVPTNGKVVLAGEPSEAVSQFSQEDLEAHRVLFLHSGPRTGGFGFEVSDGAHTTLRQIFTITAQTLELTVINNTGLQLEPGELKSITSQSLQAVTNESPPTKLSRPITFVVTSDPSFGQIVRVLSWEENTDTVSYRRTTSFTQMEVYNGMIAYKHANGSASIYPQNDVVTFDVFLTSTQNLTGVHFNILIGSMTNQSAPITTSSPTTPLTAALSTTALLTPSMGTLKPEVSAHMEVEEGGSASLTTDDLEAIITLPVIQDGRIKYIISSIPSHGSLHIGEQDLTENDASFRAAEVGEDGIEYTHEGTEERQDSFNFTITISLLIAGSYKEVVSRSGQFLIDVLPVNDHNFRFLTPALRLNVIQGAEVLITPSVINVEDEDNFPEEISYRLFSQPSNGKLVFVDEQDTEIGTFTQKDVNDGKVLFKHDGGVRTGAFLFEATDGLHKQLKQFYIIVTRREISVENTGNVTLTQGSFTARLAFNLMDITSNERLDDGLQFNITAHPLHGYISMNGSNITSFDLAILKQNVVIYTQVDYRYSEDSLTLVAYDEYTASDPFNMSVVVISNVYTQPIHVNTESQELLSPRELNASLLSDGITGDVWFEVVQPGLYARVVNSSAPNPELFRFNYTSLRLQEVAILVWEVDLLPNETLSDTILFNISAAKTQTVTLELSVNISVAIIETTTSHATTLSNDVEQEPFVPRNRSNFVNPFNFGATRRGPTSPPTTAVGLGAQKQPVGFNILFVVIPLLILFLIIIAIILFIVFRTQTSQKEPKEKPEITGATGPEIIGKPPLAVARPVATSTLPHVSVIANPNANPNAAMEKMATLPIINRAVQSPLVPQVTVTPLGRPPSPKNSYASLTSNGSAKVRALGYNWDDCDPELVDHFKQTNPSLGPSQYWV